MTTPPSLPSLAGLSWSRHKKPGFSTRVASHVSGREVRVALMSYPLYEFEAVYNGLASSATPSFIGLGAASLQNLRVFSCSCRASSARFSTPIRMITPPRRKPLPRATAQRHRSP
jgi:hypothetical protein